MQSCQPLSIWKIIIINNHRVHHDHHDPDYDDHDYDYDHQLQWSLKIT